jgi:nitroimidazol reductase NimA-like FMN-containing flavoprotein (pyridoxamine 5'-phosphate oxidase superfamily)
MHTMRRSDKEITDIEQIEEILRRGTVCRIALKDEPVPYVVPLNYGYRRWSDRRALFFHSASRGRKIDLIMKNPEAAFVIETDHQLVVAEEACRFTMHYASVMGTGRFRVLEEMDDKRLGMTAIMEHYTDRSDWELPDRALGAVTVLVLEIDEISGKRSPASPREG